MTTLAPPRSERNETALERLDRNLIELMQEVRVAQTGVQVLFGFLLTVPFTARFGELDERQRRLYFATLAVAGAAAVLLIAPSAHHRILFRRGDKERLVRHANRYALAGLGCVALAMVGALLLVADVLFGGPVPVLAAVVGGLGCAWCWFIEPCVRRRRLTRDAGAA